MSEHGSDIYEVSPTPNDKPAIWDLVKEDIDKRDAMGVKKYGTRLQPFNGRDALWDAYQEHMDLIVYLRQAIYERDAAIDAAAVSDIDKIVNNIIEMKMIEAQEENKRLTMLVGISQSAVDYLLSALAYKEIQSMKDNQEIEQLSKDRYDTAVELDHAKERMAELEGTVKEAIDFLSLDGITTIENISVEEWFRKVEYASTTLGMAILKLKALNENGNNA